MTFYLHNFWSVASKTVLQLFKMIFECKFNQKRKIFKYLLA